MDTVPVKTGLNGLLLIMSGPAVIGLRDFVTRRGLFDQTERNSLGLTGSFRMRLPVAAKIALATAGNTAAVPGSPIPPGASVLFTMCTSTTGA